MIIKVIIKVCRTFSKHSHYQLLVRVKLISYKLNRKEKKPFLNTNVKSGNVKLNCLSNIFQTSFSRSDRNIGPIHGRKYRNRKGQSKTP